jgi:hypothetical protein
MFDSDLAQEIPIERAPGGLVGYAAVSELQSAACRVSIGKPPHGVKLHGLVPVHDKEELFVYVPEMMTPRRKHAAG